MAFGVVYSTHRWDDAPQELKDWITAEHGEGPWALIATVPDGRTIPRLNIPTVDPDNSVSRSIPGGVVVAWAPRPQEEPNGEGPQQ